MSKEKKSYFTEPEALKAGDHRVLINGMTIPVDFRIISEDTYQKLQSGSFGSERPEPKLEVGKSYRSKNSWVVINRNGKIGNYGFSPEGNFYEDLLCSTHDQWEEISEAEAIQLLEKECVRRYGEGWRDVKIKDCVFEPGHELVNIDSLSVFISTHMILNKNGCIFRDGVWAEKLEQSEIKEGQMIWFKDNIYEYWVFRPFSRINRGNAFSMTKPGVHDVKWDQYSITNPYPDSIEARAIELLRKVINEGQLEPLIHEVDDFVNEIDSYDK